MIDRSKWVWRHKSENGKLVLLEILIPNVKTEISDID